MYLCSDADNNVSDWWSPLMYLCSDADNNVSDWWSLLMYRTFCG